MKHYFYGITGFHNELYSIACEQNERFVRPQVGRVARKKGTFHVKYSHYVHFLVIIHQSVKFNLKN